MRTATQNIDLIEMASSEDIRLFTLVREGIPAGKIKDIVDLGFPRAEIIKLVGASSTIERKIKERARLSRGESDRLARLARVFALANRMFGNPEKARKWLGRPLRRLGDGLTPLQLLESDFGARKVEERLYQIGYGMYA